ncbi:Regulatory particle non-ATPase 1 [Carabus blaptoides fortunei]
MPVIVKNMVEEESEEDRELKDELRTLVEKLLGKDEKLYLPSLEMLRFLIRTATSSMTSVPKPLKYLAQYYAAIKLNHDNVTDIHTKKVCADIVSVLAMNSADTDTAKENRDCLHYCLLGTMENIGDWGHEYVRQLECEICEEWALNPELANQLLPLVHKVIEFDCKHHSEIQACDLLMEIDQLDLLEPHITDVNYPRICLYLTSCANFVDELESTKTLNFVFVQYKKYNEYVRALIVAMQLRNDAAINELFNTCCDSLLLKQMAYIAGRQHINVHIGQDSPEKETVEGIMCNATMSVMYHQLGRELDIMEARSPDDIYKTWLEPTTRSRFNSLTTNIDSARMNLASSFVNAFTNAGFSRDKLLNPEQGSAWVYRNRESGMLSATASVGAIYLWDVDTGLTAIDRYLYSTVDYVKAGALMAVGIMNCRVRTECDPAMALLSDYVTSSTVLLQIGAVFGLGMAYAGTNHQAVLNLLLPVILTPNISAELLAVTSVSCGLIAVSTCNSDVTSVILQKLIDSQHNALIIGGSYKKLILLGLGLCYLGRKDAIEAITAALEVFPDPFKTLAQTIVQVCAYTGTNDVLIVQEFLHICSERYELPEREPDTKTTCCDTITVNKISSGETKKYSIDNDKKSSANKTITISIDEIPTTDPKKSLSDTIKISIGESTKKTKDGKKTTAEDDKNTATGSDKKKNVHGSPKKVTESNKKSSNTAKTNKAIPSVSEFCEVQAVAALGVALVGMGDEIGQRMSARTFGNMAQYGHAYMREAVSLGMALCSLSNPEMTITDILNKYSHDIDDQVASNAIFSMGLIGAGTNNARLATMLRHLASYHARNPRQLFMVRIAQGLIHMGKGTLTLNPFHTDRQLSCTTALAGLLITVIALLDNQNIINGPSHYLLYSLCTAMQPRWLVTLNEDMNQISVPVRVGEAVDIVAKAGTPKSIAGIHTHTTPVLLAVGERAELATDHYEQVSPVMEGIVLLRKKENI